MKRMKTFLSLARYEQTAGDQVPARYWLDEMLNEGLAIPEGVWNKTESSFLLLLAGKPGTGKSSFATELCYRLAKTKQIDDKYWRSFYISSESTATQLIENAGTFGWESSYFKDGRDAVQLSDAGIIVYGYRDQGRISSPVMYNEFFSSAAARFDELRSPLHPFDVVVIDSLNVLHSATNALGDPTDELHNIIKNISFGAKRPRLLIVVLDGYAESGPAKHWEYLADAAFRFDGRMGPEGYYQRTFQILKIKTQSHAWGEHTLKIVAKPENTDAANLEGGVLIFPSLHWHLSQSIRNAQDQVVGPRRISGYPTPLTDLNKILGKDFGFPKEHTTAMVGLRGALKSYLSYYFMLAHAMGHKCLKDNTGKQEAAKNVLLISLRDDDDVAMDALKEIAEQQGMVEQGSGMAEVRRLMSEDRLEILYNWPGCVTPAEFFHKIYLALTRKRRHSENGPSWEFAEIVVVNGLDHLHSKFPLCAAESVFVSALIALFRCHKVCSIITSSESQESTQTDLAATAEPHADLILKFSEVGEKEIGTEYAQRSDVTATRVPSAQIGGRGGKLGRLATDGHLVFVPTRG